MWCIIFSNFREFVCVYEYILGVCVCMLKIYEYMQMHGFRYDMNGRKNEVGQMNKTMKVTEKVNTATDHHPSKCKIQKWVVAQQTSPLLQPSPPPSPPLPSTSSPNNSNNNHTYNLVYFWINEFIIWLVIF